MHTHMQACINVHTHIHTPRRHVFLSNGPVIHTSPMTICTVEIIYIYTAEIMRSTQHTLFVILDFYHSFRKLLLSLSLIIHPTFCLANIHLANYHVLLICGSVVVQHFSKSKSDHCILSQHIKRAVQKDQEQSW